MFRFLFIILIFKTLLSSNEVQTYSICVCTTTTLENAVNCKNNIKKTHSLDTFIVKDENQKYLINLREQEKKDFTSFDGNAQALE